MTAPRRGLYETLLTAELAARLAELPSAFEARKEDLEPAEAPDRLALHLGRVLRRAVECLPEGGRTRAGIALARELVARIHDAVTAAGAQGEAPLERGELLRAVAARAPDGRVESIDAPHIPLLDTTLLTNAPGEPRVGRQLLAEIASADRVDVVMAFIRRSGVKPLLDALRRHCERGCTLRILTTTYTGSTEGSALDLLQGLGAQVRVSYDTSTSRLHAKAWLFHRESGFSTAYVGSSNLTHSAHVDGLEWNVRVSGARNPDVIDKIGAVFEAYWHNPDFEPYAREEFDRRCVSQGPGDTFTLSPLELRPEPFQERLLEQIALARAAGRHRNLLVSATGTGKTVMAALDYQRLRSELPRARLLFVAHREELLVQSLLTFRQALRDASFGEPWVGGKRPVRFEHVFASIQSLSASGLEHLDPGHFDVLIVDEFHHAAAASYQLLLERLRPRELLGLTATPERSDGQSILHWFEGRIAAELRLWDAIEQQRLTPFLYYGIHDGVDLREVAWKRGQGYDVEGLSTVLTGDERAARLVLKELLERAQDPARMKVLGFCVSREHARFMACVFAAHGLRAAAVLGDTPEEERRRALAELQRGELQVLFSVDLFNEGLDVPSVDTLLLLRPTESPTLFLQQLGRGLRRAPGKSACTVLDFVGLHRKEFRFDRRFRALLGGTRRSLEDAVRGGFPFLPAGCHLELDPLASEVVLNSLRNALPATWNARVAELRALAAQCPDGDADLATFLRESGLELEDVYDGKRGWSDLRADAGLSTQPEGPKETVLRRALGRLLHVDDPERIELYRAWLGAEHPPRLAELTERERRLLRMLVAQLLDKAGAKGKTLAAGLRSLWEHPQVRAELLELLAVLGERLGHLTLALAGRPDVPLQVHARYTRLEILAALGVGQGAKVAPWQTGVRWVEEARADLLAFTLDKTRGSFSPTTRYRDYAISRELIHWESQSATRADSPTGLRYRQHRAQGSDVLLFARLGTDQRAFWFLGPAEYVGHVGELPMAVTWRLHHPLPGDLLAAFAAAVA